jgi:ubiquinone/menaquinone biosynthesis C-methylase UbiE
LGTLENRYSDITTKFDSAIIHYVLHDISSAERESALEKIVYLLKPHGRIYIREPTRKNHGISPKEIERLMEQRNLLKVFSKEEKSFPLTGKVYEGIFLNVTQK